MAQPKRELRARFGFAGVFGLADEVFTSDAAGTGIPAFADLRPARQDSQRRSEG